MEEKLERHMHKLGRECPPHWVEHFFILIFPLSVGSFICITRLQSTISVAQTKGISTPFC